MAQAEPGQSARMNKKDPTQCGPGTLSVLTVLEDAEGRLVPVSALRGKMVLVYCSAHWCPPCQAFSPALKEFAAANKDEVTVLFCSFDHSEQEFLAYSRYLGFLRVPWSGPRKQLSECYNMVALPLLVVVDGDNGAFVTDWGRSAVTKNPSGCLSEWRAGRAGVTWLQLLSPW